MKTGIRKSFYCSFIAHVVWLWSLCLSQAFCLVDSKSFLIQTFAQEMVPHCPASSLSVGLAFCVPPSFPLLRCIQVCHVYRLTIWGRKFENWCDCTRFNLFFYYSLISVSVVYFMSTDQCLWIYLPRNWSHRSYTHMCRQKRQTHPSSLTYDSSITGW